MCPGLFMDIFREEEGGGGGARVHDRQKGIIHPSSGSGVYLRS